MYNLAHLSFFEDPIKECFNESVKLLIKSLELNFHRSEYLLIIVLLHKHGNDYDKIKKELDKNKANNLFKSIMNKIDKSRFSDIFMYKTSYEIIKNSDFLYDYQGEIIISNVIPVNDKNNEGKNDKTKCLSTEFYKGFGIDI